MRSTIIQAVEKEKIIAILRGVPSDKLLSLAQALYDGGIRLLELTYSADKSVSDEETAKNIKKLVDSVEGKMFIGAGSVLTEEQVDLTKQAGGEFIISPDVYEPVIRRTRALDMVSMPGALTPTEIRCAVRAGADFVKLFPISALGTSYLKAVKAPLSNVKFLAVGGIDENNAFDYYQAGAVGFGISSSLTDKKLIADNDWAGISKRAKTLIEKINRTV